MTAKKKPEDLQKRGRKTDFKEEYIEKVYHMSLLGLTDIQMSGILGVSEQTFNVWKKRYPEFLESLKSGKSDADAKVAKSLFGRAIGYDYSEVSVEKKGRKILKTTTTKKRMAPDTTAAIFWLKNRQPELWRDRVETNLSGGIALKSDLESLSDDELQTIIQNGGKIDNGQSNNKDKA